MSTASTTQSARVGSRAGGGSKAGLSGPAGDGGGSLLKSPNASYKSGPVNAITRGTSLKPSVIRSDHPHDGDSSIDVLDCAGCGHCDENTMVDGSKATAPSWAEARTHNREPPPDVI